MRIFTELLFQHGHIADVALAQRLAQPDTAVDSVEQVEPVAATVTAVEPAATPVPDAQTQAATAQRIARRERGMARLGRRLLRAMTALSPFR